MTPHELAQHLGSRLLERRRRVPARRRSAAACGTPRSLAPGARSSPARRGIERHGAGKLDVDRHDAVGVAIGEPPQKGAEELPLATWLVGTQDLAGDDPFGHRPVHPAGIRAVLVQHLSAPLLRDKGAQLAGPHRLDQRLVQLRARALDDLEANHAKLLRYPVLRAADALPRYLALDGVRDETLLVGRMVQRGKLARARDPCAGELDLPSHR